MDILCPSLGTYICKWACMQSEGREKRGGGREGRKGEEKEVEKQEGK